MSEPVREADWFRRFPTGGTVYSRDSGSPKGPESEARPEAGASLQDRISRAIEDEAPVWTESFHAGPGIVCSVSDASVVAARVVEAEVERLTAEVERLQVELGTIRGELADFAQESVPSHVSTLQAVRWLIAEHTEQVKHNGEVGEENRALCNERDEWKRAAEAETQGRQAEVSRLREQLAAQPKLPATAVDDLVEFWHTNKHEGFLDDAARAVIAKWGVSSSEVEAPQPPTVQHKVRVTKLLGSGQSVAVCPGCREGMTGTDQEAEDWKDQHLADTLRPVLNEGRPSGSERLAPRPQLAYVDRMKTECCASEGMTGIDCRLPKGHADWHSGRFDPTGEGYESGYPVCIQWPRNESDRCEPEQDAAQAARSEATPRLRSCVEAWPDCESGAYNPSCCRFPKSCSCTIYDPATIDLSHLESPSPSLRKEGEGRQSRTFYFADAVEPSDIDQLRDSEGDVWERRDTGQWHCLNDTAWPPRYFQRLLHDFGPLTEVLPPVSSQEEKEGETGA